MISVRKEIEVAGQLRYRIKFFREKYNEWGEPSGLAFVACTYAAINEKNGSRASNGQVEKVVNTIEIDIRSRDWLSNDLVILYEKKVYDITSLIKDNKRKMSSIVAEVKRR